MMNLGKVYAVVDPTVTLDRAEKKVPYGRLEGPSPRFVAPDKELIDLCGPFIDIILNKEEPLDVVVDWLQSGIPKNISCTQGTQMAEYITYYVHGWDHR